MLSDILRWGGKRPGQPDPPGDAPAARGGDILVSSKALPKFLSAIAHQSETPVLIDLGPVIGANVSFFGEQLGCKLFIEDLFADYDRHARAGTLDELAGTLDKRFRHEDSSVDGILCWDVFDYLPKASAQALARQIAGFPPIAMTSDRQSAYESFDSDQASAVRREMELSLAARRQESQKGAARFARGEGRHGKFERR